MKKIYLLSCVTLLVGCHDITFSQQLSPRPLPVTSVSASYVQPVAVKINYASPRPITVSLKNK